MVVCWIVALPAAKLRGFATITVEDCLAIHDVRIIEGDAGLFVSMPLRRGAMRRKREGVLSRKNPHRELHLVAPIERELVCHSGALNLYCLVK